MNSLVWALLGGRPFELDNFNCRFQSYTRLWVFARKVNFAQLSEAVSLPSWHSRRYRFEIPIMSE